jgi:hypothetical protein
VTWVMSNLILVSLESVLVSVQDRCTVCAKRTIGLGIVLDTSDGTRLNWKLVLVCLEIVLILIQDRCIVCTECIIGLKIVLDATEGTPGRRGSSGSSLWSVWRQC